ncbi:MAG: sulfite exporter TauE/SafE family protein [Candidatus Dormibacteria bacterium]
MNTRALLASPLGFLIGLSLGALGGGGSILAVPALIYGAGQGPRAATTTSLVVVGAAALSGLAGHLHAGRVRVRAGLALGVAGVGGSFAGSALNRAVPSRVLLLTFAVLMVVVAWRMWPRAKAHEGKPGSAEATAATGSAAVPRSAAGTALRLALVGTGIGLLTGFFGVGGGFVVVPGLVLALGYDLPVAVGTSLLVIAINSAEGLAFRLSAGGIDWSVAIPFTGAALVGALLGSAAASRVPAVRLTRAFVVLLVVVAAYMATRTILGGAA